MVNFETLLAIRNFHTTSTINNFYLFVKFFNLFHLSVSLELLVLFFRLSQPDLYPRRRGKFSSHKTTCQSHYKLRTCVLSNWNFLSVCLPYYSYYKQFSSFCQLLNFSLLLHRFLSLLHRLLLITSNSTCDGSFYAGHFLYSATCMNLSGNNDGR